MTICNIRLWYVCIYVLTIIVLLLKDQIPLYRESLFKFIYIIRLKC